MEVRNHRRPSKTGRFVPTLKALRAGDGWVWTVVSLGSIVVLAVFGAFFLPRAPEQSVVPSPPAIAPVATPAALPSPAPVAAVDSSQAPAPGMDPQFAPPDGPGPDSPPFGVDALAMRDELRTHGVDLPDSQLQQLVDVADKYIAQGDPDLDAWDPQIKNDVVILFPTATPAEVIDTTRCTAEYIERVIARNNGWVHPPDEDDHDVTVDGRGPAPRVESKGG